MCTPDVTKVTCRDGTFLVCPLNSSPLLPRESLRVSEEACALGPHAQAVPRRLSTPCPLRTSSPSRTTEVRVVHLSPSSSPKPRKVLGTSTLLRSRSRPPMSEEGGSLSGVRTGPVGGTRSVVRSTTIKSPLVRHGGWTTLLDLPPLFHL